MGMTVRRTNIRDARSSSRALIMFKPGFKMQIEKGVRCLSEKLEEREVKFRWEAPILLNMTNKLANVLYKEHVGKDWFENIYKDYIMGTHPDNRIPSSPISALILEMKKIPGKDPYSTLRSVIGPTDPFDAIAKYPEKADEIKNSVRYALIGDDPIEIPGVSNCPVMNKIHCSSDEESAEKEIAGLYLSIFEYVLPYYSKEAAEFLKRRLEKTKNNYKLTENDFRVPLLSDKSGNYSIPPKNFSINDGKQFYKVLVKNNIYKDFKRTDIFEIFEQMQALLPLIMRLEEDFISCKEPFDLFNYPGKQN